MKEISKTKGFISWKLCFQHCIRGFYQTRGKILQNQIQRSSQKSRTGTKLLCSCPLPLHLSMWLKFNVGSLFCEDNVQNFVGHPFQTEGPRTCLSISWDSSIVITAPYLTSIACLVNIQTQKVTLISTFLTSQLWFRV